MLSTLQFHAGVVTHSAVKEGKNGIVCTNEEEDIGNTTKLA